MDIHPLFLLSLVAFFGMMCLVIVGLVAFTFYFFTRFFKTQSATFTKRQEIDDAFREFAQLHNLALDKGSSFTYPNMSGTYRDRTITISLARLVAPPPDSHTLVFTQVKNATDVYLKVAERGRYYHKSGIPEFILNSQSFDDKFQLWGNSPDWAQVFLTQATQSAILELGVSLLQLEKGRLAVYVRGFETRQRTLESLLNLTCTLAEFIDEGVA